MNDSHISMDARAEAALVAELNDLLQVDYEAAAAYTMALSALDDPGYKDAVRRFKGDHERHIDDLTALVQSFGGTPLPIPHAASDLKVAVQTADDDAAVIASFKSNEVHSRDKYRRAASRQHPSDVQGVLIRAARDEQRHFDWVMRTLGELGVNTASVADALEEMQASQVRPEHTLEAGALKAAARARRTLHDAGPMQIALAGLMLVGAAAALTALVRRR